MQKRAGIFELKRDSYSLKSRTLWTLSNLHFKNLFCFRMINKKFLILDSYNNILDIHVIFQNGKGCYS